MAKPRHDEQELGDSQEGAEREHLVRLVLVLLKADLHLVAKIVLIVADQLSVEVEPIARVVVEQLVCSRDSSGQDPLGDRSRCGAQKIRMAGKTRRRQRAVAKDLGLTGLNPEMIGILRIGCDDRLKAT